jgi:hypothetical protein
MYRRSWKTLDRLASSLQGAEGIPNIKGPDGNWWNDIDLDLPKPVVREARVEVEDLKIGMTYVFTLRRVKHLGMVSCRFLATLRERRGGVGGTLS